jgi:hypothetical protein
MDLSVIRGRLTVEEAVRFRYRNSPRYRLADALEHLDQYQVRYATAGALRAAGFVIYHTPGRVTKGLHCSVVPSGAFAPGVDVPWPKRLADALDGCFNEPEGMN